MSVAAPIFQIVHEYVYFSQHCNNVYFYIRNPASGASAQYLVDLWISEILPDVLSMQPPTCQTTAVRGQNLFSPLDTGETLLALAGTYGGGGDYLPPFVAAEFTLDRSDPVVRNGKKRILGGTEASTASGAWTGGFLTILQTVADALLENLVTGLFVDAYPFIVERIFDSGSGDYRLPTNATEANGSLVADVLYDVDVTTQNSRKFGRGA